MAILNEVTKSMLLSLKPTDITKKLFHELFADTLQIVNGVYKKVPAKINLNTDQLVLKKGEFINKSDIVTTPGRFIFNKLIIEDLIIVFQDYINEPVNGDVVGDLDGKMANALLKDVITAEQYKQYLNRVQWLGMSTTSLLSSSLTSGILTPIPKVIKRREELVKQYKDDIDKGDVSRMALIEKELVEMSQKELANDEGMYIFKSKARGSFGNNYKNTSIVRGPLLNPRTGKFEFVASNFIEGMQKEDIPPNANSVVSGAYPKAIGQRSYGYMSKQLTSGMQAMQTDKPGSDCHTKETVAILVNNFTKKLISYRYIVEGGKLVYLDESNINKYIGKVVNLRSPMTCANKDKICSICNGRNFEMLGITNVGLTSSRVSTTMSNKSMKKFQDLTVKTVKLDKNNLTI